MGNETEKDPRAGKPGEPGERGTGQRGGAGGQGGAGGEGGEVGGLGGPGGTGGQLGPVGPRGPRGPTNPRALIGYLFFSAGVILAFAFTWQQGQKLERASAENTKATDALCTLRADLSRRVSSSNELLDDHPVGDIFGIPRELIISGRDNQQETLDALDILECPPSDE